MESFIVNFIAPRGLRRFASYIYKQRRLLEQQADEAQTCHAPYIPDIGTIISDYFDYMRECEILQYNLADPAILYPKDLAAMHRRTSGQIKFQQDEAQCASYKEAVAKYVDMVYTEGDYLMRVIRTPQELTAEGKALSHCVGGYADSVARGISVIFALRRQEQPEQAFYTLQYIPRTKSIAQLRGFENCAPTQEVHKFANNWLQFIKAAKPHVLVDIAVGGQLTAGGVAV